MQETLKEHLDGEVDIICSHVTSQVDLGMSLRHSDDRLNVSDGDWDTTNHGALPSDVGVELSDLVLVNLGELGGHKPLGVDQVLLQ